MINNPKKREIMKRIIQTAVVALVCLVAFQVNVLADNDKPVNITQLPATAQQIIKKHFSSKKVALAKAAAKKEDNKSKKSTKKSSKKTGKK